MDEYSYTSIRPLGHTGPVRGSLYLYLYFMLLIPYIILQSATHLLENVIDCLSNISFAAVSV